MKYFGMKLMTMLLAVSLLMVSAPLLPRVSHAAIVSPDGWAWQNPCGNTLFDIWGNSSSDIFAVGANGTILHCDGYNWIPMDAGTTDDLYAVWGSTPSNVLAVGQAGTILRYDGNLWTRANTVSCLDFVDVWGSSASDVYAVGPGASAHFDGTSWTTQCDSRESYRNPVYAIWGSSATDIFKTGRSNMTSAAWILHNGALEWSWSTPPMSSLHLNAIWGRSPTDVFVVGDLGTSVHYDGTAFSPMAMPGTANLSGVWGNSSTDVFAVGSGGTICHYDGTGWMPMASGTTSGLSGVWGSSSTDVYAVGDGGVILHYDGATWDMVCGVAGGMTADLYGVWGSSPSDVFAVGKGGTIVHYDGSQWSPMLSGNTNDLQSVWGTSAFDVFAVGYHGTILHYDGITWSPMPNPYDSWLHETWDSVMGGIHFDFSYDSLYGIWGSSPHDVYAVGGSEWIGNGTLYRRGIIMHYDGITWDTIVGNADCLLLSAWGTSYQDIFVCGDCNLVGHFDGNAWSFTHLFNWTDRLFDIWGSSSTDVLAVGGNQDSQYIRHYDGTTWTMVDTGSIVGSPHGVWGSSSSSVFVVNKGMSISQSMFYYNGTTWRTMNSGTKNDLYDVWGTSEYDVFAVGSGGTILHYGSPVIQSLDPQAGIQGESLNITIKGISLSETTGLDFGPGTTVYNFTVQDRSHLTASVRIAADADPGIRDVSLTTSGGVATLRNGFAVRQASPIITSLSPSRGVSGTAMEVVINGAFLTDASEIDFGSGIQVDGFTVDSSSQITVCILIDPAADPGARDIYIVTPGGTYTLTGGFNVMRSASERVSPWAWGVIGLGSAVLLLPPILYLVARRRLASS